MKWKAKKHSEVIVPVLCGPETRPFTCRVRRITPRHWKDLRDQCTTKELGFGGKQVEKTDEAEFNRLFFDTALVGVKDDLTTEVVNAMIELEEGEVPDEPWKDREFIKFLWEADETQAIFALPVLQGTQRALELAAIENEERRKNLNGSVATPSYQEQSPQTQTAEPST